MNLKGTLKGVRHKRLDSHCLSDCLPAVGATVDCLSHSLSACSSCLLKASITGSPSSYMSVSKRLWISCFRNRAVPSSDCDIPFAYPRIPGAVGLYAVESGGEGEEGVETGAVYLVLFCWLEGV